MASAIFPKRTVAREQTNPHPDAFPSDGRGNSQTRRSQFPKRLDTPTAGGRFSLSHPMGEGRLPAATAAARAGGEGECVTKFEVVFARVLLSRVRARGLLQSNRCRCRPGSLTLLDVRNIEIKHSR